MSDKKELQQEVLPPQPTCPELHQTEPANSPYRRWFESRGFDFTTMTWKGPPPR